jgi:hypothetical protein
MFLIFVVAALLSYKLVSHNIVIKELGRHYEL